MNVSTHNTFITTKTESMKKLLLAVALLIGVTSFAKAQTMDKAIGLRFTNGAEISFQNPLSNSTRLELDLGLYGLGDHNGFVLSGLHQWVFSLDKGLNWYVGLGGQLGSGWYENKRVWNSGFGLAVAGQIGIEYNFSIPLQVSVDYRPAWYIIPAFGGAYDTAALSLRYRF